MTKSRKNLYKKRNDRKYLEGRLYVNLEAFLAQNPNALKTEMDTVYNDVSNGPFMQTFRFDKIQLLFGLYHDKKNGETMLNGINKIDDDILGHSLFNKYFEVLVTDRGSEFTFAEKCEFRDDKTSQANLFYCD